MIRFAELETLQDSIHFLKIPFVKIDQRFGFQHTLISMKQLAGWQTPQKSAKEINLGI